MVSVVAISGLKIMYLVGAIFPYTLNSSGNSLQSVQRVMVRCFRARNEANLFSGVETVPDKVLHSWIVPSTEMHMDFCLFIHLFKFCPPVIQHSVTFILTVCVRRAYSCTLVI